MEHQLFRCRHCQKLRLQRRQDQRYCGSEACQKARRNAWRRSRLELDPDYRTNQQASTKAWLESQGGSRAYYRRYRQRRQQQSRCADHSDHAECATQAAGHANQADYANHTKRANLPGRAQQVAPASHAQQVAPAGHAQQVAPAGHTHQPDDAVREARRPALAAAAKSDAETPQSWLKSGTYRLVPDGCAKSDAVLVQLSVIAGTWAPIANIDATPPGADRV